MKKREGDERALLRIEADISEAIEGALRKYGEDGVYWHCEGLPELMSKSAMHTLRSTSHAAQWGHDEL